LGLLADWGMSRMLLFFTTGRFSQGLPVLDEKMFRMADTFTTQERGRGRKKKTRVFWTRFFYKHVEEVSSGMFSRNVKL
jgi:hypothetical protein